MVKALEAAGGDASVLAHHAAAASDVPRILRYTAAAAAEAARSGAHRKPVAFYELAPAPHRRRHRHPRRLLEALARELYLTDRLTDAIAARTCALALRPELGDVVAVGAGHGALPSLPTSASPFAGSRSRPTPSSGQRLLDRRIKDYAD
jgi:hypothetical protein